MSGNHEHTEGHYDGYNYEVDVTDTSASVKVEKEESFAWKATKALGGVAASGALLWWLTRDNNAQE
jgi:hypothetical protein